MTNELGKKRLSIVPEHKQEWLADSPREQRTLISRPTAIDEPRF